MWSPIGVPLACGDRCPSSVTAPNLRPIREPAMEHIEGSFSDYASLGARTNVYASRAKPINKGINPAR
jgi:hypothetical protein